MKKTTSLLKKTAVLLFASAFAVLSAAEKEKVLYCQDFSEADEDGYRLNREAEDIGGVLHLPAGSSANLDVSRFSGPIRLSFKVRMLSFSHKAGQGHWGLTISGGDGYSCQPHSYGRGGFINIVKRNGGKVGEASSGRDWKIDFPLGKDAKWTDVEVDITKDAISVSMNGTTCFTQSYCFLPLKSLAFYGYRTEVEIDDVKVTQIVEKPVIEIEKPVFSANFDNSATAVDQNGKTIASADSKLYTFTQGVSGQALSINGSSTADPAVFAPRREWEISADRRFVNSSSSIITINLPQLEKADFSCKFQRLGDAPANYGHFLVFSLVGENGKSVSFSSGSDTWKAGDDKQKLHGLITVPGMGKKNNDPKTNIVKISYQDGMTFFSVNGRKMPLDKDGKLVQGVRRNLGKIKKITINSYGVTTAIDELSVTGNDFSFAENFNDKMPNNDEPVLDYELDEPFNSKVGTIMFWVKANDAKGGRLFNFTDGGKNKAWFGLSATGSQIDFVRENDKKTIYFMRRLNLRPGDWYHVALTWDKSGNAKHFVNGLPYHVCFIPGQRSPVLYKAEINKIKKLVFNKKSNYAIDDLKIYHRTLSNSEIVREYRSVMPIDMVMENSILDAEKSESPAVQVAPGGYYMRPNPVPLLPEFTAENVTFDFELTDFGGKVLSKYQTKMDVDKLAEIKLPPVKLPVGRYFLVVKVGHDGKSFQRTFDLSSYKDMASSDVPAVNEDVRKKELIFEKVLTAEDTGKLLKNENNVLSYNSGLGYLESGSAKNDRFSFVIPFDEKYHGKPLLLEIDWPDDKLRNMGFYMYWGNDKPGKGMTNRDRLQSGIQAGEEYPNSGKMQTSKYIFFAGSKRYLFEARTMAPNANAAVGAVRVYTIENDALPKLKLRLPEGMEGRHFGHYDEDQTFTTNLNADITPDPAIYPSKTLQQQSDLFKYFDYTGQDLLIYALWRYSEGYVPVEGHIGNGMWPNRVGELEYILNNFAKHGKRFIAQLNYTNTPDFKYIDKIESDYEKKGMIMLDRKGNRITPFSSFNLANFAHPEVQKIFMSYVEKPLARYGKNPGFAGLQFMTNFGTWGKLEYGYDDWTVGKFTKDTGIKVPAKPEERYAFLTAEPVRKKWLKWRSEQFTGFIRSFRAMLDKYNKDLIFMVTIPQLPDLYESKGVDFEELKKIPGVTLVIERPITADRHSAHWGSAPQGKDDLIYDMESESGKGYLKDGAAAMVLNAHTYFETFNQSLDPKNFPNYFQNNDPKPHGRFFLKTLSFNVAAWDALEIACGMQPLGTLGRDAESREFAQAYRALPAKPFILAPGIKDPVVVRYLPTKNGTYFYAVNTSNYTVKAKIAFDKDNVEYMDLSTGKMLSSDEIELKSFQLRSFLVPKQDVKVTRVSLGSVPGEATEFYTRRRNRLYAAYSTLAKNGIDVAVQRNILAQLDRAIAEKRFGEAHRLSFLVPMRQMLKDVESLSFIIEKKKMTDAGHYAINCGSFGKFYKAPNGKLFFPDQQFDGKYGYIGKYNSTLRILPKLTGPYADMPELYRSEAYNLDGYDFNVPNGKYTVKIYLKIGYKPGFTKDDVYFKLSANGKLILNDNCLYTMANGDFSRALMVEAKDVPVKNGKLQLRFTFENTKEKKSSAGQTARLVNAIEVIRQR